MTLTQSVIEGISTALSAEFGDNYTIYADNVEQGLKAPCFFILCVDSSQKYYPSGRFSQSNQFDIQFIPTGNTVREKCGSVAERLFRTLKYIKVGDAVVRGTSMKANIIDGTLAFLVNYTTPMQLIQTTEPMTSMRFDQKQKGERQHDKTQRFGN